jgi:hypothetical protein
MVRHEPPERWFVTEPERAANIAGTNPADHEQSASPGLGHAMKVTFGALSVLKVTFMALTYSPARFDLQRSPGNAEIVAPCPECC